MSSRFLVWRLCDGYANASTFEAYGHDDAAARAHGNDFEYDDEETFCVQHSTDRKVRVFTVVREFVPNYTPREREPLHLKARCTQCRARFIDSGDEGWRGLCQRCNAKREAAQVEEWAAARRSK
jgi:hypothetical protein